MSEISLSTISEEPSHLSTSSASTRSSPSVPRHSPSHEFTLEPRVVVETTTSGVPYDVSDYDDDVASTSSFASSSAFQQYSSSSSESVSERFKPPLSSPDTNKIYITFCVVFSRVPAARHPLPRSSVTTWRQPAQQRSRPQRPSKFKSARPCKVSINIFPISFRTLFTLTKKHFTSVLQMFYYSFTYQSLML